MWGRVYVSFPQAAQVRQVVSELEKAGVALAMLAGAPVWAVVAAAVAVTAGVLGERFAVRLPHGHRGDMRVSPLNGVVVLLVNLPRHRVREIETLIGGRHEAFIGRVGWTILSAGT